MYADDTQLYVLFHPSDKTIALQKLQQCVDDIKTWSVLNKLKFNDSKTEVLCFASRFISSDPVQTVTIGTSSVSPSVVARNLGVAFDNDLKLTQHVIKICQSAAVAVYKIGQIRKYLDLKTTERLIHAFVTSRLDFCNSLLYGLPQYLIGKLQRVQNSAARLTAGKRDHVSDILRELHWLPINERIEYKLLLITYKCVHGLAPSYLTDLLKNHVPPRTLRSSSMGLLDPPRQIHTSTYGERAFSAAAPKLWNALPTNVRSAKTVDQFKSRLKYFLFTR